MGGANDPGVALPGDVGAERVIFPALNEAEQFHLGRLAQVPDLVQEQGPAGGAGDQTLPCLVCPCVRPLPVPEEGVGEQDVVQSGHVHGHQLPAAAAEGVDGAPHQLLPRSRLP